MLLTEADVGELTIKTDRAILQIMAEYYVRVQSKAGTSALVPIHVVNTQVPVLN